MKNPLILFLLLFTFSANAQVDSMIEYNDSLIYTLDTNIYYGGNDTSPPPNYIMLNYHYIVLDSTWESQLIITDSVGKWLTPIPALTSQGAGASGTTWFTKLDSASVLKTPLQLCDSLFLPKYQLYIGTTTKL